jgi:hypothetical protein
MVPSWANSAQHLTDEWMRLKGCILCTDLGCKDSAVVSFCSFYTCKELSSVGVIDHSSLNLANNATEADFYIISRVLFVFMTESKIC